MNWLTIARRILFVLVVFAPTAVTAAPYWSPEEVEARYPSSAHGDPGRGMERGALQELGRDLPKAAAARRGGSYLDELTLVAQFLAVWQVSDVGPNFGGIREGEHLPNIIQTDNTSEAIWVWTRYFEVTGDNTYFPNIEAAFTYSLSHPAYLEEGGSLSTTGYYRMYNCGWAVTAEQKFRDVYNDLTYKAYGDSCGSYLRDHTLVRSGSAFYVYVNPPVLSWAMGNLYNAGVHEARTDWIDAAVQKSRDQVKGWVEVEPTLLSDERWAMSGGATVWGMCNSYLLATPDSTGPWLTRYESYLDTASSPGDFETAWNGWYAYGHLAVGEALNDAGHLTTHADLTALLMAEDGDLDGGIPAKPADTDAMDQTWVANYMAAFGLSPFLTTSAAVDADAGGGPVVRLTAAPNPFSESTTLRFQVPFGQRAEFEVFDAGGRTVAELGVVRGAERIQTLIWDGRGHTGEQLAAGTYWIRARGSSARGAARLIRLR